MNNKLNKELNKNFGKANLKLTNFVNSKNIISNNNNKRGYLPRAYRNINTEINEKKKF